MIVFLHKRRKDVVTRADIGWSACILVARRSVLTHRVEYIGHIEKLWEQLEPYEVHSLLGNYLTDAAYDYTRIAVFWIDGRTRYVCASPDVGCQIEAALPGALLCERVPIDPPSDGVVPKTRIEGTEQIEHVLNFLAKAMKVQSGG